MLFFRIVCGNNDDSNIDKSDRDYPFLCMDLTYLYTILSEGFGIPNTKSIHVSTFKML